MQLDNFAAWIKTETTPLVVDTAPIPACDEDELVIQNKTVAINQIDWKIQSSGGFGIEYPAILGEDVAGQVIVVGSKCASKFHVGQRVMAHALGIGHGSAYGGFQLYTRIRPITTSPIPDRMSFADAAVLPLSLSTAATGLFKECMLGLRLPGTEIDISGHARQGTGSPTILVWGGSSSVGSTAIQLLSGSHYTVVTTASPSNVDYCKSLGATHVVDYHTDDVTKKLTELMKGNILAGAYDAIGSDTTVRQCATVLKACGGGKIASVGSTPDDLPSNVIVLKVLSKDIDIEEPEIAERIWGDYVPLALQSGMLVSGPKPIVAGNGLEEIQHGLKRQKQGVSAEKVIVVLKL